MAYDCTYTVLWQTTEEIVKRFFRNPLHNGSVAYSAHLAKKFEGIIYIGLSEQRKDIEQCFRLVCINNCTAIAVGVSYTKSKSAKDRRLQSQFQWASYQPWTFGEVRRETKVGHRISCVKSSYWKCYDFLVLANLCTKCTKLFRQAHCMENNCKNIFCP